MWRLYRLSESFPRERFIRTSDSITRAAELLGVEHGGVKRPEHSCLTSSQKIKCCVFMDAAKVGIRFTIPHALRFARQVSGQGMCVLPNASIASEGLRNPRFPTSPLWLAGVEEVVPWRTNIRVPPQNSEPVTSDMAIYQSLPED